MRSLLSLALGIVLAFTIGIGSVSAAAPEQIRETGTFEIPDFCGTGATLDVAFWSVRSLFWDADEVVRVTYMTKYVITTAGSDNVLIRSDAGQGTFHFVPEADGGYAIVNTARGLAEQVKEQGGPLLYRDAGLLLITDHFDADDNYLGTDVTIRGPHPDFESDFVLQCEVITEALDM